MCLQVRACEKNVTEKEKRREVERRVEKQPGGLKKREKEWTVEKEKICEMGGFDVTG